MNDDDLKALCSDIYYSTGIPINLEGVFRWIVFLPSINDVHRPVPTRYYGAFRDGSLKVRGIDMRQASCPKIVSKFQKKILNIMSSCRTEQQVRSFFPEFFKILRFFCQSVSSAKPEDIIIKMGISKTSYVNNNVQRVIVSKLKQKGIPVHPGQLICFIRQQGSVVLPEDYSGFPDIAYYQKRLKTALFSILVSFDVSLNEIVEFSADSRQCSIFEYNQKKKNS